VSLDVGQVLGGRYAIERVLGRSTLGIVFQGRDQTTNQHVAVRLIKPEFDNEQVATFNEGEARTAGQLTSIHFARLINIGFLPTGERCILTEYIDGETLKSRILRLGRLSDLHVAQILLQLLEGLAAAHGAGIVHRDLTPSSIMLAPRADGSGDHATLLDFGISRQQALSANPGAANVAGMDPSSFQYLSPEQLNGLRGIDPRSNIYSLGAIAYEAITGRRPFEEADFSDPSLAVLHEEPRPVEELAPGSSSPFGQLVRKAMARSPNARFQRAEEMTTAISEWIRRAFAVPFAAAQPIAPAPAIPAQLLEQPPVSSPQPQTAEVAPASRPAIASSPTVTPPMPSGLTSASPAPASAPQAAPPPELFPPPMPPTEVLAQMAPVQTFSAPASTRPVASQSPEATAPAAVQMVPPAMTAQETLAAMAPVSTRVVAAPAPSVALSPPPPPLSPNEVAQSPDIDQSVVDALFAPAPAASRDELVFGGTDNLGSAIAASDVKSSPAGERLQPPRLEPTSSPDASRMPDGAEDFHTTQGSTEPPAQGVAPAIAAAAAPVATGAAVAQFAMADAPQRSLPTEPVEEPSAELAAEPSKRTILGLGMGGSPSYPSPPVEPALAPEAQQVTTGRPPQTTTPGIQPSATSSSAPTIVAATAPAAVGRASVASAALDDLGPYDKTQRRLRKPLVIALVLVGVVGVGTAIALLQGSTEQDVSSKSEPSQVSIPASPPRSAEVSAATPTADTRIEAASKEPVAESGKAGTSLSQAMNAGLLSQSVAAAQGKRATSLAKSVPAEKSAPADKSANTEKSVPAERSASADKSAPAAKASAAAKPAVVAKPAAKSVAVAPVPNKSAPSKAASSDPYKYR